MPDHDAGKVGASAAEVYDSFFVPALFQRFAAAVADAARVAPADNLVDVACGTGALTRELRGRTTGRVAGVDINPGMLDVARRGDDIEYIEADAADLPFTSNEFDLATSQFGLMFFPDPPAGVAEMRRVATRGTVAIWDSIDRSSGYTKLRRLFEAELGSEAAESLDPIFAMGADGAFDSVLAAGGITDAELTFIAGTARFASVSEWVTTEVRGWTLGETVSDEELEALLSVAERELAEFSTSEGCLVPMSAQVAIW